MSKQKAITELAKYLAYSNAAEFIRQHGEEGHRFEDDKLNKAYDKYKIRIANMLDKLSEKHIEKYHAFDIDINSDVDEHS